MMNFEKDIDHCLATLSVGGLILYPTDTIWGIGCDATDAAAVQKIYRLKQRADEKSMIVLVADERDVLRYTAAPDLAVFDHIATFNRPVTVIYEHGIGLADNLLAADGSVGMRICKDEFCRHLLKRFRKPIVSTSANISGQPSPKNFNEVDKAILSGVDYVVQYRQDDLQLAKPSRIIKWLDGREVVVRE
jgi:L-threonylcarbamoyladenylate synthase